MGALCSCPCRPSRSTRARDPAHESHVRLSLWAISRKPTYEVPPPTPELSTKKHEESVFSGVESPERHRDEDDDDDEREHWVSPRGEERLRLQRRARWDKISSTRAAASSPRSSSAGSSVLSPAGVRPLARLTGVENGADRTPPTIASSQGDVGFTRSVAGSDCAALPPSIRHSRRVRSNGSSSATPGSASSAARRRRAASLELEDHAAFPLVDGSEEEDSWDEYFRVSSEFISKDESPGVGLGRRLSMSPTTFTP